MNEDIETLARTVADLTVRVQQLEYALTAALAAAEVCGDRVQEALYDALTKPLRAQMQIQARRLAERF